MYKLDKTVYRKYFFYGIENKEEALEGIIYFSYFKDVREKNLYKINSKVKKVQKGKKIKKIKKVQKDKKFKKLKTLTVEELVEQLVESAANTYLQYYKFIELNNGKKIFKYNNENKKDEIKSIIRQKIKQLENTNEIMTKDYVESQIQNEIRKWQMYYRKEIDGASKEKIIEETIERLAKVKKITLGEKDIQYSRGQRIRFSQFPEGCFGEGQTKIVRNWTENLYDTLKNLEIMEQEDKIQYKRLWLRTRFKRLENSKNSDQEEDQEEVQEEMKRLKEAYNLLRPTNNINPENKVSENNNLKTSNSVYRRIEAQGYAR